MILTEALAQTAGIAAASGFPGNARPLFLLSAIQKMKFFGPARPEEEIFLKAARVGRVGDLWQFDVRAEIGARLIAEGQLVLNLASKSSAPELE